MADAGPGRRSTTVVDRCRRGPLATRDSARSPSASSSFAATLVLLFGLTHGHEPGGSRSRARRDAGSAGAVATRIGRAVAIADGLRIGVGVARRGPARRPAGHRCRHRRPSGDQVLVGAGDIARLRQLGRRGDRGPARRDRGHGLHRRRQRLRGRRGEATSPTATPRPGAASSIAPGRRRATTTGTPRTLAGYLDYFGDARGARTASTWYSYDLGAWHVVDARFGVRQGRRLRRRARRRAAGWPPTSRASSATARSRSGITRGSAPAIARNDRAVDPFWQALYAAGADVVVNGHDHDYERFAPQDPDGREDRERGIREFVVGTGGAPLCEASTTPSRTASSASR